jgi:hypothetical protein
MANPWDNDEVISKPKAAKKVANPWDDDEVVSATPVKPTPIVIEQPSLIGELGQSAGNLVGGALRGAGSIGATILWPLDKAKDAYYNDRGPSISGLVTGKPKLSRNEERRQAMDDGLEYAGADPKSFTYQTGKLATEVAGTMGAGGAIGQGIVRSAPVLARVGMSAPAVNNLATAVRTSGFTAGPGGNLLTRMAGGAISGGASATMVDPKNGLTGAGVGTVLPGATKLAGAIGGAVRNSVVGGKVSAEVAALARRAKELGITIPADRIANSKPLNALASALDYVPFSGRAGTMNKMESGLNRALSRTFGQDSDNVTGALRKAQDVLGAKFDDVLKNNTVRIDNDFMNEIGSIEAAANRELGADGFKAIKGQIDELLEKGATGEVYGQAAYNIKRTLDRIGARNTPEAFHAIEMKKALIEALNRSIGPTKAAAFAETRKQYGNMMALEKVAKNGAEGEISVARLANMKNIGNKDLQELADISAQFVKAREGAHGSMQRAVLGVGGAVTGGLPGLAVGVGVGRGTNALLNSNGLKNMLLDGPGPMSARTNKLLESIYGAAPVAVNR